jgi:membrane-associated phospholipid phosphatase
MRSSETEQQRMRRLKDFLGRRLSPEEDLGLHLTVGMMLSLCLLCLFVAIAHAVESQKTEIDHSVGLRLAEHREESPATRNWFVFITEFGSFPVMTGLAIGGALVLMMAHRRLLALVWLLAPAGGGLLDEALKHFYVRERPSFPDSAIHETTLSFPSGHSVASVVGYGLLAYVLVLFLPRWWMRILTIVVLGLLALSIGFSRVYLGAHYLTDVMGGFAVGGCWLAACISAVEAIRRRHGRKLRESLLEMELAEPNMQQ